ncbi:TetR/AcrR family transcriptional regulator [Actinomycetospora sp. CA-084318]|uniref:TetR/AcrR family transcriptional regulator n=1 Tax=Actinomycetospora sp. CA-084318 TaxID=3239892 RepID=UPI003D976E3D
MVRVGLTAARLVASGVELADEIGFAEVTLSALARRHGVKVASLYSHVANSHDLKSRLCLLALDEMADRGAAALAGRAGKDALVALAGVYRTYAHEHPGRYAAAEYPLDAATAATSAGPRHAEMARAVLRGYDLAEPDRTHAVRLLGSVIRGFVNLEIAGGFGHSEPDADQSWAWSLDALDALLRRPAVPTSPEGSTP